MPAPRSPVNSSDRLTAIAEGDCEGSDRSVWNLCKMPFWQHGSTATAVSAGGSSRPSSPRRRRRGGGVFPKHEQKCSKNEKEEEEGDGGAAGSSVSSVARALLAKRRLKLDPAAKLYFPYEPGKQVRSAIRIKNISKFHIAFKFQTTSPKSCFMRPPGAVLAPGETIVATVFKFVERPEDDDNNKQKLKFKILSLKVKGPSEFIPEWFDREKEHVRLEQILRVIFLDKDRASSQMEKLKRLLAEAEDVFEARKKPTDDIVVRSISEVPVIDEWKRRREQYLLLQQQQQTAGL